MYVHMVTRLHRDLMQTLCANYVNGYIQLLPAVIDIFWTKLTKLCALGVLFLKQLAKEAPQSQAVLQSIRCTERIFSRLSIDLALEQTVNRDAVSPMRCVVGFQCSYNVIHIDPTHDISDGTAASSWIRNNRAASNAVRGEQNWERRSSKGCLFQCSHRIV